MRSLLVLSLLSVACAHLPELRSDHDEAAHENAYLNGRWPGSGSGMPMYGPGATSGSPVFGGTVTATQFLTSLTGSPTLVVFGLANVQAGISFDTASNTINFNASNGAIQWRIN